MEINSQFDIQEWWRRLDISWKRIFKQAIDINHTPDHDEIQEILDIEAIDCSKSRILSLEPLQYLKKIRKLDCSHTNISSLEKIRDLILIDELNFSDTKVKSLEPISNFSNLWILKCQNTPLENLNGMEKLKSLEYFYCSGSKIRSINPLRELSNLKVVDCGDTNLESIEPLKGLSGYEKKIFFGNTPASENVNILKENSLSEEARDPLFETAATIVVETQQASASLLQRRLKLGYNRAGKIIDQLEVAKIISPFDGSRAREVIIKDFLSLNAFLSSGNEYYTQYETNRNIEIYNAEFNPNIRERNIQSVNTVREIPDIIIREELENTSTNRFRYRFITAVIIATLVIVYLVMNL